MIRMTDRAEERVEAYVGRVRSALAFHSDIDADEVARDVRDHVEEALRDRPEPVGEDDVAAVLDRLGSPGRWAPAGEVRGWRGVLERIRGGPGDWRLAYLCLAVTVLGLATVPIGVGILLLLPAFVLARAVVELSEERGETLGARRWLVYPALHVVYAALALLLFAAPAGLWASVFSPGGLVDSFGGGPGTYPEPGTPAYLRWSVGWTLAAQGAWWCALGGIAAARPGWVRAAFRPFADGFRRARAWVPVLLGVLVSLAGVALLVLA